MTYVAKEKDMSLGVDQRPSIEVRGPGCEGFLVLVPAGSTAGEIEALASRITTLLDHAYHAGREHALYSVRAAIGCKP